MLNSESCDPLPAALESASAERARKLAEGMRAGLNGGSPQTLDKVSRDFASVFYSALVQQMQKTVEDSEDEETALSSGVQGFFGMFMPQAIAGQAGDPLAGYIKQSLARHGNPADQQDG